MATDQSEILCFDQATIEPDAFYHAGLWQANLRLKSGELALVKVEASEFRALAADAAQGLCPPSFGTITFRGRPWNEMTPYELFDARGEIGRIFGESGWISNLNIDENILLPLRYHAREIKKGLYDEAAELAEQFDLPGLPRMRPAAALRSDLRRAACVRAFLGQPKLLVLERPERDDPEIMLPLLTSIRSALNRGAAVLWFTAEKDVFNNPLLSPNLRLMSAGSQLLPVPEVLV